MLEAAGWIALATVGIVLLFVLLAALPFWSKETPREAAETIERFLAGEVADAEWDAFTSIRPRDPIVRSAKQRVREIVQRHSCSTPPTYLDESGVSDLRELADWLRESAA